MAAGIDPGRVGRAHQALHHCESYWVRWRLPSHPKRENGATDIGMASGQETRERAVRMFEQRREEQPDRIEFSWPTRIRQQAVCSLN